MGKSSSFGSRSAHKLDKMPSDPCLFPSQQNESILKSINTSDRVHIILKSNRKKKQNQAMLLSLITPFFLPNLATHGAVDNRGNKDYSYPCFIITLSHTNRLPITIHYPYEKSITSERFRGRIHFEFDKCIACEVCVRVCPIDLPLVDWRF